MLSFFRKYERTFFLIVFAPAILGMGVTSVIVTVLTKDQTRFNGRMFGEPISQSEWDAVIRPWSKVNRGGSEEGSDAQWRFYAMVKTAEKAGIRVPDAKVGEDIMQEMKIRISQMRAAERVRREGLDLESPEGRQKWQTYFLEAIQNPEWSEPEYRRLIEERQMSVPEFEGHKKREEMKDELLDFVKNAATVAPEEIWKTFRDRSQTRAADLLTLDASAYVPSSAAAVSDSDVETFYKQNKELYDEPRRVEFEYVAAPFDAIKAEVPAPTDAQLQDYYDKHQDDWKVTLAPVGTAAPISYVDSFSNVRAKVNDKVSDEAIKERAQNLLEQVATKLDEQLKKDKKIDMQAATDSVAAAKGTKALVHNKTGLLEPDQISTHAVLNGFAAYRWANNEPQSETRTSEPLSGEKCKCILRTAEIKAKRSPTFAEIKDRVRDDYWKGNDKELKRYYDSNSWKYRTLERWKVDVVVASYDEFAKDPNIEEPAQADLDSFWNVQGAKLWPGKAQKDVTPDELKKAFKYDKATQTAQAAIAAVRDVAREHFNKDKRSDLDVVKNDDKVKKAGFLGKVQTFTLDRAGLAKDPLLKKAYTSVPIQQVEEPSEIFTTDDGKSQFVFAVRERLEQKVPEFSEVRDQVAKDLLLTRGFDRARDGADKLLTELKDLKGEALTKKLAEKGLKATRTDFFTRTATGIPGMPVESQKIVTETYACEVDGAFERVVTDKPANKVYLVRCAAKKDPNDSDLALQVSGIRKELLRTKREELSRDFQTEVELKAKGITPEHVKWVRARRNGPGGQVSSKVKQIFVPNDRATIDGWLDDAARKRLDEALAKLKKDVSWQAVVFEYSDDTTKGTEGALLDVSRGDLVQDYGAEFEDKVFALPADGQVSVPIKSKKGWHLIKVTKPATAMPTGDHRQHGGVDVRMSFKHLLVKTDPVVRGMPDDVAKKAREIARAKVDKAKERLAAGEPFAKVGSDVGADDDARARGEPFEFGYVSPVMRMALRQTPEATQLDKVLPEELDVAGSKEWHLMLCSRDPMDREPSFRAAPRGPRLVFETVGPTQDSVLQARRDLERWQKDKIAEAKEPSFAELAHEWKKICERRSSAPSATKEGAFGVVSVDQNVRALEDEVVAKACSTAAGQRTDVIESKDGFRILEVVSIETKPADDAGRDREIGEALLRGTGWIEDR